MISRSNYNGTIYGGNFSTSWPDNTTGANIGIGYDRGVWTETFFLQDQYNSNTSIASKLQSFKTYADKARTSKFPSEWLCNHVSLAGQPKNNAKTLNPQAAEYLISNPGRCSIVMMDFACDSAVNGDVLVNAIVNQNTRYSHSTK